MVCTIAARSAALPKRSVPTRHTTLNGGGRMSIRTRIRHVGGTLARHGWLGPKTGAVQRAARAFDRHLAKQTAEPTSVARLWDRLASDAFTHDLVRHSWTGLPAVHANHNYLVSGDRDVYWVDWVRDRYFPEGYGGDVLSLGCGTGHLDRIFGQRGLKMRSLTGFDISPAAVARAQALADAASLAPTIRYHVADLNHFELPPRAFDFVYFFQSLHHIEALEHVLDGVRATLRPGGLLLVNEFVGPSRFQWTDEQLRVANVELATLPSPLRKDLRTGLTKTAIHRPTVAEIVATDPSEAVRSAEIESVLRSRFEVIGEWNWGGTINHLVFQNIAVNFDPSDESHLSHVERLIQVENAAVREGRLPSDFKVFIAR
jgi:SAM-dependent methyltransferase